MAERRVSLSSPLIAGLLLLLVFVVALLLTPADARRGGDWRLTVRSTEPQGASALRDVASRLGWATTVSETPFTGELSSSAVYAVLHPSVPVTSGETHHLLEAVRAGAGLLVVLPAGSALADSLGIEPSESGGLLIADQETACADSLNRMGSMIWQGGEVLSLWLEGDALADTAITFAGVDRSAWSTPVSRARVAPDTIMPAAAGFHLGSGRVVAVADPDLLRNDVIRVCRWGAGFAAVRMLEWLSVPSRGVRGAEKGSAARPLIFDEYHHGYGIHANPVLAVRRALTDTPAGRALLHAVAAALVLLIASGIRALPPRPRAHVERRSALEHVSALASAYERAGATRLATRLLVRGLHRRHVRGGGGGASTRQTNEQFLNGVAARHPQIAADADTLLAAEQRALATGEFLVAGEAAARINDYLRSK